MAELINVFQPSLGEEELSAVRKVFASHWVGRGEITGRFERAFAAHLGADEAQIRSVSCCTEGLFQSMALLGIGPGDEVVLPSVSFVGAANAVASAGARPVFCDVDVRSLNATAGTIQRALSPKTRAVLLLHYGGVPCRMDEILELLRARGVPLIEDSACSVASQQDGRSLGTFGDVGVWSFDAMKILVTCDGGMVYCSNPELAERLGRNINLGLDQPSGISSSKQSNWWQFEVDGFGRRAIMNDVGSAIGLVQLRRLSGFIQRRGAIHDCYNEALGSLPWLATPPPLRARDDSSYYLYWIQTEPQARDRLAAYLRARGIYTTFRYYPLHQVDAYGYTDALPGAETAGARTLCLPIHQGLTDEEQEHIINAVLDFNP